MNARSARIIYKFLGIACSSLLFFSICSPTEPTATPDPFSEFVLTNQQISDWKLSPVAADSVFYFVDTTLNRLVNGGNYSYCGECDGNSPLKAGVHYVLSNSAKNTKVTVFVMDYGIAENAKAEFDSRSTMLLGFSKKVSIPSFPESTAIGAEYSGGITAMAWFGKYYFELGFLGYSPSASSAADANQFMLYFQSKINQ